MAMPLPQIVQVNGRPQLQVDGRPFLILGLQWDCDSCFSRAEMNPLFAHAARMGANTAALPLYWREIEPEPGVYDFDMLDERLAQARANGLRLVLLWFATWKNACSFYAPDYIKQDPKTYRLAQDAGSQPTVSLCPTCAATWERDNAALQAVMAHLAEYDAERTVILSKWRTNRASWAATAAIATPATRNTSPAAGPSAMATRRPKRSASPR